MKKLNNLKEKMGKKGIIAFAVALALCIGIGGWQIYAHLQSKENERKFVESETLKINEFKESFDQDEVKREQKLEILVNLEKSYDEYKNGKINSKELDELYESSLKMVKKYFTDSYDADLEKLLLEDIEKIDDKEKINESVDGLGKLLKLVETEKVANEEELNNYKNNINELVEKYEKRVKEIEKEEQEKKEAEEQAAKEAAEAAEAERKAAISNQNNASNNASGNSNGGNSASNGSSSSNNNNGSNNSSSGGESSNNGYPVIPGTNIQYIKWSWAGTEENIMYLGTDGRTWYDKNGNILEGLDVWD